jgi:hypothetical protein
MFRICLSLAIVALLLAVRSSHAANCTATTFQQDMNATQLAASKLLAADYANSTKQQIVQQFLNEFGDKVVSFDYNVTQNGSTVSFTYKIIYACNETTTTVLPDGSNKTTQVVSQTNASQVEQGVSAGT